MRQLTQRQLQVLQFIKTYLKEEGYPPTIREIGARFKMGPRAAKEHVDAIERKGFLRRKKGARRLELSDEGRSRVEGIPIIGRIPAGVPVLSEENISGYIKIDESYSRGEELFFLKVTGDSMRGASIEEGDYVLVRRQGVAESGDIVVSRINEEATVKRLKRKKGRMYLVPENPDYSSIEISPGESVELLGKVIAVFRKI